MSDELSAEHRHYGDDVAAYALGALAPEEAEAFRRHLETCVVCRDELAAFEQVVTVLPASTPRLTAPPGLRRRVMREVVGEGASLGARGEGWRRRSRRWRSETRPWGAPLAHPALALGATLAIAFVLVIGAIRLGQSGSSRPATRVIDAKVAGHGSAQLRISGGHAELVVHGLSAAPAGKVYEVWLAPAHGAPDPTSALFGVTRAGGNAYVGIPGKLHGIVAVLVTPEPAGGSSAPTHAPVISASLT